MNSYGERMLAALAQTGVMNVSPNTELYAEMFAYANEIDLLRNYLNNLYKEMFICTAENEGLVIREETTGGVRNSLTILQRRQILTNRSDLNMRCVNRSNIGEIFNKLGVQAYVIVDNLQDFKLEIDIYDYHTPEESDIIERQILGVFPAGYDITFVYG